MTETAKVLIAVTLFFAREVAFQNLPHLISVLKGDFAAHLFVIFVEWLQDFKAFVALVYVIYLTLW